MYDREHRFFASALVVSLVACVAFAAALGLAPTQKAYADGDISTQASGYTEVQLLEYINTNIETMLTGFGMLGENTSQTHPTFRWLYTAIQQINSQVYQIYWHMDDITDYCQYMFNRLTDIRAALVADTIEINGQVQTTVRNYARLAAENTDSMTTVLQAWNRDMGASLNGTASDAKWFSTVSARLLAMLNAINAVNTNTASIHTDFWDYFVVPQSYDLQDGGKLYTPAYYFQYLQMTYNDLYKLLLTSNQITVDGTNYRTPHFYLDKIYDFVNNIDYYVPKIYTDTDLLVKLFSQETVTINSNQVYTPYYYLKNALEQYNGHTLTYWVEKIYEALTYKRSTDPANPNSQITTINQMIFDIWKSIGQYSNGYVNGSTITNSINDFRSSWNTAVVMLHDYLDSLIYLLETPDSNTSEKLIGDFDDDAYEQNMQQLRQQLGQVGVFSAVTSLGMIVYTISDADTLQSPSLDVPFEFAGSNDHLVIDLSWLDDFKPMINFACMALLFLQLAAWTVEAVKET